MNKHFKFISMVLTLVFCFSAIAFGQRTTGNIEGTIADPSGANVPNATVTAKSTGTTTGFNQTVTTDENGFFQINQIPAGTYTVTVGATGFKTSRADVTVVVDKSAVVNAQLEVGGADAVVDVTADTSVTIDITDTKIDTNITKQIIDDLPSGTQFASLLKVAPNVRPEALAGGFQIDGASGAENVFILDGQEVTNFRTGQLNANFNVPFEIVQEVQVKSTGYEAEYGGATGGIINVVTGGGNDQFRGNLGVSFRPAKFQGDPRPFLNRFSTSGTTFEYFNPARDGGTSFFPVASLSGPIVKGKLWVSATYAPQIFDTTRTIDYFANGANPNGRSIRETISYQAKQRQEQAFVRLDAQPISKLRIFGTFLYNPIIDDGVLPANTEGLTGAPQSANFGGAIGTLRGADYLRQQGGRQNANAVNGQVTYNPTNNLIFNFRGGRSFLNEKLNSYGLPNIARYICSGAGSPQNVPGSGCNPGFSSIANNFQTAFDVSTRTTFDADVSLVGINLAGRHNFKFGYQLNRLFNTVDQGYKNLGIITLFYGVPISSIGAPVTPTGATAANPTGACAAGQTTGCNLGSGRLQRFGTVGEAKSDNQGFFAQDSWTISNRLTVNLGIRAEKEVVPNFGAAANTKAIEFGLGDKISPRIGVAFDLLGDGRTKVFANYGQFYDRFKYELPRGSFGGDFFRRDFFEILPSRGAAFNSYTLQNILGTTPDRLGGNCPLVGGTGFSRCQLDFRVATNISGADIFESGAVDPNLKAARQSEYTAGIEHSLGSNFVIAGRYTHKQVDRAIEDIGVFNAQGSEAYIIGNPGFGLVCEVSKTANLPCPKAERKYDALEVRVDKRASKYFFNGSYTYSRLFGNYSGLASSDEAGRSSPNVNRFFDLPPLGFTADGDPDNGRLATDRPHVFKAFGGYTFDFRDDGVNRTTVSAFTTIQSGTPLTTIYDLYQLGTTILNGRGDLGRTGRFTETDFSVNHRYKFGSDNRYTLEGFVDFRNLFDEQNELGRQTSISTTIFTAGNLQGGASGCTTCATEASIFQTIFNGAGIRQNVLNFINANGISANGRRNDYNSTNNFQGPRDVRFGARFFF